MPELSYSNEALNVRGAFFGAKAVVYVEGDDDVLFWEDVFAKIADEHFEVEAVGGAPILDDYIERIASGQLTAIAARDADFLPTLGIFPSDPKVIYTYGYSIENSLYVPGTITQLVRSWCKTSRVPESECAEWLSEFAATIAPLVHLDVANAIAASGVPTIGDNADRFMATKASARACPKRVAAAVATTSPTLPSAAIRSAQSAVGTDPKVVLKYLRGHFIASAVHRFIVTKANQLGRKVSISSESLYAAAVSLFKMALDSSHPHKDHYLESARAAWLST